VRAWGSRSSFGLSPDASLKKLEFTPDLQGAVRSADFVQENAPERRDLKEKLFAEIDRTTPEGAVIASSSSGLTMTTREMQALIVGRAITGFSAFV